MKKVLAILDSLIASSIISIIKPMVQLQREGKISFKLLYTNQYREKDIENTDIVVLCRNISITQLDIIEYVKKYGKTLIYDIDDNFFELSVETELGRYHRFPLHLYTLKSMLENADVVRVYSPIMYEKVLEYNSNVKLAKTYFDDYAFRSIKPSKIKKSNKIKIVYASGRGKYDNLSYIYSLAVEKLINEYPEKIEFYSYAELPNNLKKYTQAIQLKPIANYDRFLKRIYCEGFDIGIAPLVNGRFSNSKTNNKYREYGGLGIAGIYSNIELYKKCIQNGQNGVLVDNTVDDWYNGLKSLIDSVDLRNLIIENAKNDIIENYNFSIAIEEWKKDLEVTPKEKQFNNINNLRIVIMLDSYEDLAINERVKSLQTILTYTRIKMKLVTYDEMDFDILEKKDIFILFTTKLKKYQYFLKEVQAHIKNIIIDTPYIPVDMEKDSYYYVTYKKSEDEGITSLIDYSIPSAYIDCLRVSNEIVIEDIAQSLVVAEEQSISRKEEYFSLESSIVKWLLLLEKFSGTGSNKRGLTGKMLLKISSNSVKMSRKIKKIAKKITDLNYRLKLRYYRIKMKFRINIFKKY